MARIRKAAEGDELVERLLTAACSAMADATENHAAEWLPPAGKLCAGKIDSALRAKYDALPSTSTSVERLHAIGRRVDDGGGRQRYENRAGVSLARFNDQAGWATAAATAGSLAGALGVVRAAEREARKRTLKQQRVEAGRAKRAERDGKLSSKRERREKKKKEKARIEKLELATRYSALKAMPIDELKDQLKPDSFGHGGSQSSLGFCDPEANVCACLFLNGRPGAEAHFKRLRVLCDKLYDDILGARGPGGAPNGAMNGGAGGAAPSPYTDNY